MLKIHELLDRDPRVSALANKGQARIGDAAEPALDGEDRAELEFFVCDGRFSDGLQRILERFLADLGGKRQEAAWVSGFFGSGKSHLLKMLAHLWANRAFGDGATARSLVPGGLPPEIRAALTELDTRARRIGKPPLAAAGTLLGGNERVRSAVLSILLRARGLPSGIPQTRFTFWLRDEGILDQVRDAVEHGEDPRDWRKELNNFLVSRRISEALLAANPTFAAGPKDVRKQLAAQFPPPTGDLTTEEFVDLARKALAEDAALPLTVLVLDEAQQYIGDSGERSAVFSEVAEAIQTEFDTRVALVASGQSALSQTPALQKLRDRFRIKIELTDADVEVVTRKVLLAKKPTAGTAIQEVFDAHEGEVSRHLRETALGPRASDREDGVKDYPLLGTRRRFWEASLRAVDAAGVRSQLRSQLAILHNALSRLADRNLGAVIPASELFHEVSSDLVNSGVLLNEIHTRIQQLDDASAEGRRRRDVAALVFLIGRLPREAAVDTGVRADATTLADLPRRGPHRGLWPVPPAGGERARSARRRTSADEDRRRVPHPDHGGRRVGRRAPAAVGGRCAATRPRWAPSGTGSSGPRSRPPCRRCARGRAPRRNGARSGSTAPASLPPRTDARSPSGCATAGRSRPASSTARPAWPGSPTPPCTSISPSGKVTRCASGSSRPSPHNGFWTSEGCPIPKRAGKPAPVWRAGSRRRARGETASCAACSVRPACSGAARRRSSATISRRRSPTARLRPSPASSRAFPRATTPSGPSPSAGQRSDPSDPSRRSAGTATRQNTRWRRR